MEAKKVYYVVYTTFLHYGIEGPTYLTICPVGELLLQSDIYDATLFEEETTAKSYLDKIKTYFPDKSFVLIPIDGRIFLGSKQIYKPLK